MWAVVCAFVFIGTAVPSRAAVPDNPADFLQKHCVGCHGPEKQKGKLRFDTLSLNLVSGADAERWNEVRTKLLAGEMPPEEKPRPSQTELKPVLDWLTRELSRNSKVTLRNPHRLLRPVEGNRVSHEALFSPAAAVNAVPDAPPRLWRLSPELYDGFLRDVGKNAPGITQPFTAGTERGLKDFAAGGVIDEPVTSLLIRNALAFVEHQTRHSHEDGKVKGAGNTVGEFIKLFDTNSPPTDALIAAAIREQFKRVLRRAPVEGELARFVALMRKNIADGGQVLGVRTTLAAVLLLPDAVFRMELAPGTPDARGLVMLAPRELAFAITFALTDRRPDTVLLDAAEKGRLATREDVAREVTRLFADEKVEKSRVPRFFREFFGYHEATEVFKDDKEFKDHEARVLVADTDRLVKWILQRDRDVLRELLTTDLAFVNFHTDPNKRERPPEPANKKRVHLAYGLPADWQWTTNQPVRLDPAQRAGILTQPSWLVAHSMNFDNHPILRGKWVREHLLGGSIPDLPITVDAQLPDDPKRTLRERMEVTRQEYCWNCHAKMNPVGLPFEMFDHFGRGRTAEPVLDVAATERNVDKKGKSLGPVLRDAPLDASGIVNLTGDRSLEGPVTNAVAMIRRLADAPRVRQVFVRHAFRYWMGRNETLGDARTLQEADRAYTASGGSMKALVTSLLTSESFRYRNVKNPTNTP